MDEKEYENFMTYLFNEYVQSQSKRRFHKHFHHMDFGHIGYEWERLVKASNLLRHINHHCSDKVEIYRTIQHERIAQLPNEIREGARINRNMLEESGFMEAIDAYYDEIVGGMKMEHMPPQEIDVMRQLGSGEPEAELSALIYIVKSKNQLKYSSNELKVSHQLEHMEKQLEQQTQELKELKENSENQPQKSRRWFKGLGKIAQGSALSIANVGLAMGAITVPVAAQTAGWGAIVSSITGVGMVLHGIGEFRGE